MEPVAQGGQMIRVADDGLFAHTRQFIQLIRASKHCPVLAAFAVGIVLVIATNVVMQVRLNAWQGDFYDAVAQKEIPAFVRQLGVFVIIVSLLLILGVSQTWMHEVLKVRLREVVSHDLLDEWLKPNRIYKLPLVGNIGENPDQRIHDDCRRLTELSSDLGIGLVQSSLLLVSFIGVLWVLSAQVVFTVDGKSFSIPGYMVWCALAYALIGSALTWVVGKPLVRLNSELRSREGKFRFALVRTNEGAEGITLYKGEASERQLLSSRLDNVIGVMRQVAGRLAKLTWVTGGYGWLALIAPILMAAPGYFAGTLSFGGLMMVVGAFFQVQQSLRWFVDNFRGIAEWRAVLWRVVRLRNVLVRLEALGESVGLIKYAKGPSGVFRLEELQVLAPHGRIMLNEPVIQIERGEHILIAGTPGSGKSTLFHALAGMWPWGEGTITMPEDNQIMYLPHRPYIPLGTLRAALAYPGAVAQFPETVMHEALDRVDLGHLCQRLDQERRWDKDMPLNEQQRVGLARVLLHRPDWIVHDEAMSELDETSRKLAFSIFEQELPHTSIITIGYDEPDNGFYQRRFRLLTHPPGLSLPFVMQNNSTGESEASRDA